MAGVRVVPGRRGDRLANVEGGVLRVGRHFVARWWCGAERSGTEGFANLERKREICMISGRVFLFPNKF